ncbi:hypothetical protein ACRC7T_19050 [Segnochrobactraceae bacterium EtOH-i3]
MINNVLYISPQDNIDYKKYDFSVLIDTNDNFWSNKELVLKKIEHLIAEKCKYFVCYGVISEEVHDIIDDFIIEDDLNEDIITTYHVNESDDNVAFFYYKIVISKYNYNYVICQDKEKWKRLGEIYD